MIKQLALISILAFSLSATAKPKSVYIIKDDDIAQAAQYFKEGQYSKAQAMYLDLASAGDKYAQYVLSVIELQGLVEEPNLIKAYAWAKVAKESNNGKLKEHFDKVAELVTNPNEEQLLSVSSDIYRKYSNLGVSKRYYSYLRGEMPRCTGSRLRGNISACRRIRVSCDPNMLTKTAREACLEFVAKIQPENLKRMKNDLDQLKTFVKELEQSTGSVTVSDEN
ncbi:hypothetical protein DZA50_05155 [Kangiella sp. HD9-110m-PIT-SAG07]|nr:hypothetical protein DZA50_05155 [Kangiella sp. HD9-110m-PIT-SAG07]